MEKCQIFNFLKSMFLQSRMYGGPQLSRQNQKPHGKTKYFTAKTKYLTAKANSHAKPKLFFFCCEVFGFAVRYFVFAVMFLVLPWGILFLPWQLWATIPNGCFLPRTALKLKIFLSLFGQNGKAAVNGAVWFTNLAIMDNNYEEASGTLAKPHVYN